MKMKQFRRAFTLVEMLTVAGICVLIAAILLPVLHSARERGRSTSCLSNLRQLGAAFSMYVEDNARRYPPAVSTTVVYIPNAPVGCPTTAVENITWKTLAVRYTRVDGVLLCPSTAPGDTQFANKPSFVLWNNCLPTTGGGGSTRPQPIGGGPLIPCPTPPPIVEPPTAYMYNQMVQHPDAWLNSPGFKPGQGFVVTTVKETACANPAGATMETITTIPVSQNRVTKPEDVILLTEGDDNGITPREISVVSDAQLDYTQDKPKATPVGVHGNSIVSRHHWNGFNGLFADNHVKWIQYGSTKPAQWTIEND